MSLKNSHKRYSRIGVASLIFFGIFLIGLGFFAPFGYKFYRMYRIGVESRRYLEAGVMAFEKRDTAEMFRLFALAKNGFDSVYQDFQKFKYIKPLHYFDALSSNFQAMDNILEISNILLNDITFADSIVSGLSRELGSYDIFNSEITGSLRTVVYSRYDELSGVIDRLNIANLSLWSMDTSSLLPDIKKIVETMRGKIESALAKAHDVRMGIDGGLAVLGLSSSREYLILFLNDTELRPGGGFIGSYARLSLSDGGVRSFIVDDVYNIDKNAPNDYRREPPEPIKKYLNVSNWFLRDGNWSPDFQTSAKLIREMYLSEVPEEKSLDGVIAITTEFVGELFDLIGEIDVEGIRYSKDNFVEVLQYKVEREYAQKGIAEEDRKKILGTIVHEMIDRLKKISFADKIRMLGVVRESIRRKDIQLYHENIIASSLIDKIDGGGSIDECREDCLMVVDANLAGLKTDPVMDKRVYYEIGKNEVGEVSGLVELRYRHTGNFDWKTTRYNVYTRLFVPPGARLQSIIGVDRAAVIEESDSGRAVFGWYWSIEPGSEKRIILEYDLPFSYEQLSADRVYDLILTKQTGNKIRFFIDAQEITMLQSINNDTMNMPLGKEFLLEFDRSGSYPLQE